MNTHHHLIAVAAISLSTVCFVFSIIILTPSLRMYARDILSSTDVSQTAAATLSQQTTEDSAANSTSTLPIYEYKLLKNVDTCTLNTLGSQGFQATQFGGNLNYDIGKDVTCQKQGFVDVLDWVLFVRQK